ncbi:hypothetical protein APR04_000454 [Promicromonospora umidemergens]|uniref:Uncharacterized protein n=1 Tax=Promicromonospora umidemergens TaxID=629679 RepID=A0ABP8XAN1_9MICO|nr:hypothetical protein [Promicromonospora umidemergens]MCP2281565.1 hypothetical protein [Promicromonospora umidemergens]
MSSTADVARDLDRVLRPLDGHGLYRNNAFRVTGLPTAVSPRQVRRHREESQNPYYVTPVPDADVPLPPSDDADALRTAFEVLRDPLARLVHELFWLRPGQASWPEHAVFAHCRALEATALDGKVADAGTWDDWRSGLRLLAQAFTAEETWEWVRRRAAEIDDPRLSVAVLRALRERLPEHVIGVSVGLAVRAAGATTGAQADPHLEALRRAGFDPRVVREVTRAAVEPSAGRVRAACETARSADPAVGLSTARDLLDGTAAALRTITTVLGADDDLTAACQDEVAHVVNNRVVGYVNEHLDGASGAPPTAPALALLRRARTLASARSVTELVDKNVADLEELAALVGRGALRPPPARRGAAGAVPGRPATVSQGGEVGCLAFLVAFLIGGAVSWWLLGLTGAPLVFLIVGAVFGGLMAAGLLVSIVEA